MSKKTKEELIENIFSALDKKKNTVNEIAENIGSNWSTVKDTLDFLEKYDLVTHYVEKNIKLYVRKNFGKKLTNSNYDTFFKLPVTDKQRMFTHSLFGVIQEQYKKINGTRPGKLITQKIVEDLNEKQIINLPSGWYLFGLTTVFAYNPEVDYPINNNFVDDNIKKEISVLTREYSKLKTADDIMFHQYKKHKNNLYLTKFNLAKITRKTMNLENKEIKQVLQQYLSNFLIYLPKGKYYDEVQEVVSKYVITMNKLLIGDENLNLIKPHLGLAFDAVWKFVATFNFYNDLSKYYNEVELSQIEEKLFIAKQEAIEQIEFVLEYYTTPKQLPNLKIETPEEKLIRNTFIEMSKD